MAAGQERLDRQARGEILRILTLVLLIPFFCSALVKPGLMPARDALGRVAVVLCGGAGPVPMVLSRDGAITPDGEALDHLPGQAHSACAWAGHAQPLLSPAPATLPLALRTLALVLPPELARPVVPRAPVPATARGPPVLS